MARFGLLGRLLLILLGALVVYGAGSLLLLRWQATHHTSPSPFLRVKQFAAEIDLFAAAPPSLWAAILRTLGTADIRVWIADRPPALDGLIRAPRLEARLRGFARSPAAAAAVYTSLDQSNRNPADGVEGFMALATFPLADGRSLVAVPNLAPEGRAMFWGLPVGLWVGLAGAAVAALAVGMAVRELRPLHGLARSLDRFDGRALAELPRASGAPDVRALVEAVAAMQGRIALLLSERTLMVGAISHDLRTFLTRLQLRVMSLDDGDVRTRCIADLDAMGGLIADALAYARGSDVGLAREPLDLADLVATEIAEREAVGTTLPIEVHLVDAPVMGDRVALRRVVVNLLDNAAQFARTRIRVTIHQVDERVKLLVEDDGRGVPVADRKAVLLPYHRVDGSRSRETGGAGLGLAIAAQIAEAHSGGIRVEASDYGGALVAVWLPRLPAGGQRTDCGYDNPAMPFRPRSPCRRESRDC